jgi:hypothetical protein
MDLIKKEAVDHRQRAADFTKRQQLLNELDQLHVEEFRNFERTLPDSDMRIYVRKAEYFLRLGDNIRQTRQLFDQEFKNFEEQFNMFVKKTEKIIGEIN